MVYLYFTMKYLVELYTFLICVSFVTNHPVSGVLKIILCRFLAESWHPPAWFSDWAMPFCFLLARVFIQKQAVEYSTIVERL